VDLNYTATWAGLATAPVGILAFLLSPIVGRNIQRLELRVMSTFAFLVFGLCAYWFASFPSDASFGQMALPRFLMGIGIACFFVPINQIILSGLKPEQIASAAGISNCCRTLSASFSTAEHLNAASQPMNSYMDTLQSMGATATRAWSVVEGIVTREALTSAVNDVFLVCTLLFLAMIPVIWMAKPPFGNAGAATAH